ncbi:hypothetical protein Psi02_54160 [Planotetraspora silvatica]|uniref:Uncharacterized protein n=1 Tax=Planotetraspora silvatica TaxID=234614 RepID=A0A8J3UPR9_9ACTN|nr:hypothetical protein [Planotetraspora silvatica]GII48992.1 hypothetical protein Psi02_54160 [Planotetraspora silvatica]
MRTPDVFVSTDPIAGEKHGYFDGWMPDGLFHRVYVAELFPEKHLSHSAYVRREAGGDGVDRFTFTQSD